MIRTGTETIVWQRIDSILHHSPLTGKEMKYLLAKCNNWQWRENLLIFTAFLCKILRPSGQHTACRSQAVCTGEAFWLGDFRPYSLICHELDLLKILQRKGPSRILASGVCVVQNKHSWNSVAWHTQQSVDMSQTIFLRLREIPILVDNLPDCFPQEIFTVSLSFSLMEPYFSLSAYTKLICCSPATMLT